MYKRNGFTLLEVLISLGLSSVVFLGIMYAYNISFTNLDRARTMLDFDHRVGLINNQLERDISAAFIPWDLSENNDHEKLGIKVNDHVCKLDPKVNPCSLAYIVTLKGAINITNFFKQYGFLRATDWNYNDYLNYKNIFYGTNTVSCTGNPDLGSDVFNFGPENINGLY